MASNPPETTARAGGPPQVDEVPSRAVSPATARAPRVARPQRSSAPKAARPRRERYEARRVRRLIRHIDPWSVLKLALLLFVCLWLMTMIAAVIVWTVAQGSGTVEKVESFANTTLGQEEFRFDGDFLFRQFGLIGLILTLAATAGATIAAVVFNLISDIIGGIWITVIEEETARPVSGSPSPPTLL